MVSLFVLDRLGLRFYPIFFPRSAACGVSMGLVIFLYYYLLYGCGKELLCTFNPL
jgi:hypothetical protein